MSTAPILSINSIAFDCYQPDSNLAAATPGVPDFSVATTYFNEASLLFDDIQQLLKLSTQDCDRVRLGDGDYARRDGLWSARYDDQVKATVTICLELRLDASAAPIPSINSIAFDYYQPDSKFAAATPGLWPRQKTLALPMSSVQTRWSCFSPIVTKMPDSPEGSPVDSEEDHVYDSEDGLEPQEEKEEASRL